ncbi:exopolyphosphatase [Flavobacterium psychrophilum]|uniref:Ppx/GppA phosphatase family protein n=1 Tax=Flavobacterium psychrophilum TaxID=96345 RepID=UPI000B7C5458|nr:exopolyphosphatase [Flavobacterium psychrophilum]EKT4550320.1 exopolyphosphatase [Flavobacterium psychrophilum]MCB6061918.1 exopolyphosphatase [Flavobacterium psychrophilum]QZL00694.1 exopolyphosphatase [Flavobacterium psychrophilum]SNA64621.1 putative secreted exopolyphosphatase [Flavobacterium psychrophilum]
MQKNSLLKYSLTLSFFLFTIITNAQLYGGIEIGSKGIKMTVLDVDNIKRGDYVVKSFWSENAGIAKGVAIDGNLAKQDIDNAGAIVLSNYIKIKQDFKVLDENIFIVGSSGVAMAKNTQELKDKIKALTNKDLDFIDVQTEGKMLLKGCVPPIDYPNAMVLDIGGGNTKGGYVDVRNGDVFVFFPVSLNFGTVSLTEEVFKRTWKGTLGEYNEKSFSFLPEVRRQIAAMYAAGSLALEKEKIFMSGGAVWAFYTLMNGAAKENFSQFKLEDVIDYDAILKNNFVKFEELAKTDKEVEAVLKTYSQKHLISGSNILQACLEALPNINNKKLYFAKEGRIAWLVSYVADRSKKIKKVF